MSKIDTLYTKKKGCRWQPFLNFLITVAVSPGYFFFLWYVVSLMRTRRLMHARNRAERGA